MIWTDQPAGAEQSHGIGQRHAAVAAGEAGAAAHEEGQEYRARAADARLTVQEDGTRLCGLEELDGLGHVLE